MKITSRIPLHDCKSCGSQHMGGDCGMTMRQRLRTVRLDKGWMPYRGENLDNYFDDEPLKDIFGMDHKEREAELMDETQGVGTCSAEEFEYYERTKGWGKDIVDFYTNPPHKEWEDDPDFDRDHPTE